MRPSKKKILVVEDESLIAAELAESLRESGYKVSGAVPSGSKAIQFIEEEIPDLVLMDIGLQGEMDGIHASREIQDTFDVPVVFLTSHSDKKTVERAKEADPFGYILKPVKEGDLMASIEFALHNHRKEKELKQNEKWFSSALKSIGDPLMIVDPHGEVTFINRAARALTGWKKSEILGQSFKKIFQVVDDNDKQIPVPIDNTMHKGTSLVMKYNLVLSSRGNVKVPLEISLTCIQDPKKNIIGVLVMFRNASESSGTMEGREKLLSNLRTLFGKDIKTQKSMLLCPICKMVNDEKEDTWNQIEYYISQHTDSDLSHCICPNCTKKVFLNVDEMIRQGVEKSQKKLEDEE